MKDLTEGCGRLRVQGASVGGILAAAALLYSMSTAPSAGIVTMRGKEYREPLSDLVSSAILNAHSLADMERAVKDHVEAPEYQKLSVSWQLLQHIEDQTNRIQGYTPAPGQRDISVRGCRAVWGIENLLGVKLPPLSGSASRAELSLVKAAAEAAIAGYRQGVLRTVARYRIGAPKGELSREFRGRIPLGQAESYYVMAELLDQWCPLGKKRSDLEGITGLALREDPVPHYRFGDGEDSLRIFFDVSREDGQILNVLFSVD